MDMQLIFTDTLTSDIALAHDDLGVDESLQTAVFISLFTDKRANIDNKAQRGWWADTYSDNQGDEIGSKLWLLKREKVMPIVSVQAKAYAEEALQWLVDDGLVKSFTVSIESSRKDCLTVKVTLYINNETIQSFIYNLGDSSK